MAIGADGKEEFSRAIVQMRNLHIALAVSALMDLRSEFVGNDEFQMRGGFDDETRDHLLDLLDYADRVRRRITHNPDPASLDAKIRAAIEVKSDDKSLDSKVTQAVNPFGDDDIQNSSGGLFALPFALDGSDPNIPLTSKLNLRNNQAKVMFGAINRAITQWTRLESRNRTKFITATDSYRMFGAYQEIAGFVRAFGGDANRVDMAQGVLPSEEPLGAADSPNFASEQPPPAAA